MLPNPIRDRGLARGMGLLFWYLVLVTVGLACVSLSLATRHAEFLLLYVVFVVALLSMVLRGAIDEVRHEWRHRHDA